VVFAIINSIYNRVKNVYNDDDDDQARNHMGDRPIPPPPQNRYKKFNESVPMAEMVGVIPSMPRMNARQIEAIHQPGAWRNTTSETC